MKKQNRIFTLVATFLFSFLAILVIWSIFSYALQESRVEQLRIEKDAWKRGELQRQELQDKKEEEQTQQKKEKAEKMDYLAEKTIDNQLKSNLKEKENVSIEVENSLFEVLYVYDGDTIAVDMNGSFEKVRLIGIDTPETGEKYRDKECYGKEATQRVENLLIGKKISLTRDPSQSDEDKYGRLLRYVYLEDGLMLNQLLIEEGFAHEYTYRKSEYKYQKEFRAAEVKARKEKKGLWKECLR